jgi:hypothetical protein
MIKVSELTIIRFVKKKMDKKKHTQMTTYPSIPDKDRIYKEQIKPRAFLLLLCILTAMHKQRIYSFTTFSTVST